MNEKIAAQYDSLYALDEEPLFDEGKATDVVNELQAYLPAGSTILDIGAGDGSFALPLAQAGYKVTALDVSKVGLQKIQERAQAAGVVVETIVANITSTKINKVYDGILLCSFLFHLKYQEATEVIKKVQSQTAPRGINFIRTFSGSGELAARHASKDKFYTTKGVLESIYKDWKIIESSEQVNTIKARRKDGTPMQNGQITFIAQNTSQ